MLKPKKKMNAKTSAKKKSSLKTKSKPKPQPKKLVKTKAKARPAVKAEPNPFRAIAIAAARAADDKKAIDVLVLDLGKTSDIADFVVIAGAESSAQMGAIESQIEEDLRELGSRRGVPTCDQVPIAHDGNILRRALGVLVLSLQITIPGDSGALFEIVVMRQDLLASANRGDEFIVSCELGEELFRRVSLKLCEVSTGEDNRVVVAGGNGIASDDDVGGDLG